MGRVSMLVKCLRVVDMKNAYLFIFYILMFSFGLNAFASSEEYELRKYSESIREGISSRNKAVFIDLAWDGSPPSFPSKHENGMYQYIFGSDESEFSVAKFFNQANTEIHIVRFGCENLRGDDECHDRYLVYYYDPSQIDFKRGLGAETLSKLFEVAFVELTVLRKDGEFVLTAYPFTYGSEPSWVNDI